MSADCNHCCIVCCAFARWSTTTVALLRDWVLPPAQCRGTKNIFHAPASIIKPVRGLVMRPIENFASFCRLDYPEYEVLFAVSEGDDRVCAVIEKNCVRISLLAPSA